MRLVPLNNVQQLAAINLTSDPGRIPGKLKITQCAEINLVWTLTDGKQAHNVLFGRYVGTFAGTPAQADAILSSIGGAGTFTTMATFMPTTGSLSAVTLRDVNTIDQPLISSTGAPHPGTSASPGLPDEVAINVTLRTALAGIQNRGRMYLPNWATNSLSTGNVIAPAVVSAINAFAFPVIGAVLSSNGYTWVIGHPARAGYTGSTGTVHPARSDGSVQITAATVRDNHWDSQRRRGLK